MRVRPILGASKRKGKYFGLMCSWTETKFFQERFFSQDHVNSLLFFAFNEKIGANGIIL